MSIKSKGRKLGRMVRRLTGLPLPIAMKIGKMVAQDKNAEDIQIKFPDILTIKQYVCGDKCCSYPIYTLTGPRDNFQANYFLNERAITTELLVREKLSKVPFGTTVSM